MHVEEANRVLDYWLCLELLSPQKLPQPNAKQFTWHVKSDQDLPWMDPRKLRWLSRSGRKGKTWRHNVTFGVVDLRGLLAQVRTLFALEEREGDKDLRIPNFVATLAIVVDGKGLVVGDATFSSLPWAMNRLVAAQATDEVDFTGFSGQGGLEETVKAALHEHLISEQILAPDWIDHRNRKRCGKGLRPLNFSDLRKLEDLLFEKCGWHPDRLLRSTVCTKGYRARPNNVREADSDLLNSFYVRDILRVKSALNGRGWNGVGVGLSAYLNGVDPATRVDVRRTGLEQVFAATMPVMMPLARWPSKHPLSFAQQFAVNRIMSDLGDAAGIFSVNGPPGTGKTTLLRDIVAAVVFRRAEALAELTDATDGFGSRSPVKNHNGQFVWPLKSSLGGFGTVVASSNNGAVENVSKELPTSKSIDAPGVSIDYFGAVADGLIADKAAVRRQEGAAWGMIAGILGNRENCSRFVQRFWGERVGSQDDDEPSNVVDQNEDAPDVDVSGDDVPDGRSPDEMGLVEGDEPLRNAEQIRDDGPDTGFIGFEAALDCIEIQSWSQSVKVFREARERVRKATELTQQRALALDNFGRAESNVQNAEKRYNTSVSELAHAKACQDDAVTRLDAAEQTFRQATFHKALAAALRHSEDTLAVLETERPAQSAENWEEDLRRLERDIQRIAGLGEQISKQIKNEEQLRPSWLVCILMPKRFRTWQGRFQLLNQEQRLAGDNKAALELRRDGCEEMHRAAKVWENKHRDASRKRRETMATAASTFEGTIPSLGDLEIALTGAIQRRERALKTTQDCREAWEMASRSYAIAKSALDAVRTEAKRRLVLLQSLGVTDAQRNAWNPRHVNDETRQRRAPWYDEAVWALRHEAFIAALDLHKCFLRANAVQVTDNLKFLSKIITGAETERGISIPIQKLWDTLFLAVPVVSTAFASIPRLFSSLAAEELGWLIIDEAGQATPQAALGSVWRARRTVVVGDPLQIEPVVPMPEAAIEMIRQKFNVGHQWHPVANSAQVLADRSNKWGTFLEDRTDSLWLGSPLRVHHRCIDPMFRVANEIAYGGMMVHVNDPGKDKEDLDFPWESAWLDVVSEGAEGHWIPAQGAHAAKIVRAVIERKGAAFTDNGEANIYVVTPFKAAADGFKELLNEGRRSAAAVDAARHATRIAGTVHTFQGKQADSVVLLLCGDPAKPGARSSFAARAPNLLNVALTRAKRRIYVVGDYHLWSKEKYFNVLAKNLKRIALKQSSRK